MKFLIKSDIVKMFRQIKYHPDDTDSQKIVWRFNPNDALAIYRLLTVTYGTAAVPFLALRLLLQLVEDEHSRFPLGAEAIRQHSHMDDIFAGADDLNKAIGVQKQGIGIFGAGQFPLGKWASTHKELCLGEMTEVISLDKFDGVSTLGLI